MNKFDKVLKQYLNEETITVNTDQIENAEKKIANDPAVQKSLPILQAQANALDNDKIHKGLNAVIDPNDDNKFSDVFTNETDKQAALDHLAKQGVPIGPQPKGNQQQTSSNQQSQQNPTTQPQQNKSISGSTSTNAANYGAGY